MILDKIKTLVGKIAIRTKAFEGRRLLIGDTVYGYSAYGTVIHPQEFEYRIGRSINNPKSLIDGSEVYVEFSDGSLGRYPAKYLERADPYLAIARLRKMRDAGNSALSNERLMREMSFLERVAERAFDYDAHNGSRF